MGINRIQMIAWQKKTLELILKDRFQCVLSNALDLALSLPWNFLRPSPSGGVSPRSCVSSVHIRAHSSLRGKFTDCFFTHLYPQTMRFLKAVTSLMIHLCIPSYFWYVRCFIFHRLLGQGWEYTTGEEWKFMIQWKKSMNDFLC